MFNHNNNTINGSEYVILLLVLRLDMVLHQHFLVPQDIVTIQITSVGIIVTVLLEVITTLIETIGVIPGEFLVLV
jgi:hypothetical protein